MTIITKQRGVNILKTEFNKERFSKYFNEIVQDTGKTHDTDMIEKLEQEIVDYVTGFETVTARKLNEFTLRIVADAINETHPDLKWVCASAYRRQLYKDVSSLRGFNYKEGYGDLYSLLYMGVENGLYDEALIQKYSRQDIEKLGEAINPSKDKLLDFGGINLLSLKYLTKNYDKKIVELPQERFMVAAMYLLSVEKDNRVEKVIDAYNALSNLYFGLATPTLMNAGKPNGSLSSCQIVTLDDDLRNIFDGNKQTAEFSQAGAGVGIYLGKLRSNGSWIRGHKGRASGVVHPARLNSVLAEYVNQLG